IIREPHALTVIAAPARFQADLALGQRPKFVGVLGRFNRCKAWNWCAQFAQAFTHHELILRINQCRRLWLDVIAGIDQRGEVLIRHVLMVKGNSRGSLDGLEYILVLGVVPEYYVGAYLFGRGVTGSGEQP